MQIKIERSDYKTRRQMDIISKRLLKAGYGLVQEAVGAPKENIRVSCRPSQMPALLEIILGNK